MRALMACADCVVLVGTEHIAALRAWQARHPHPGVTFLEVPEPRWARFAPSHRIGRFVVYLAWLRRAARAARRRSLAEFDFVWHATYSAYWLPTPATNLGLPCVWGPVGGAVTTPRALWRLVGVAGAFNEALDYLAVRFMARLPATRRTWRNATITLVQNEQTRDRLPPGLRRHATVLNHGLFTETGPPRTGRDRRCLFVGSLESRKGAALALYALARCPAEVRLVVVGDGPARSSLERLAGRLGVAARVDFAGAVPHATAVAMIGDAAAVVFTGLREEGGIALAEAISSGTPVVVLAHGGAAALALSAADPARVVPVAPGGVSETAERIAIAMTTFVRGDALAAGDMLDRGAATRVVEQLVSQLGSRQGARGPQPRLEGAGEPDRRSR